MNKKLGLGAAIIALLATGVLALIGSAPVAHVRKIIQQGQYSMVDSSWQIHWCAFLLAGLFIAGIVFAALPDRNARRNQRVFERSTFK